MTTVHATPPADVELTCRVALGLHLEARLGSLPEAAARLLLRPTPAHDRSDEGAPPGECPWFALRRTVHAIKILDPACGEGHFLAGMLGLLFELDRLIGRHLASGQQGCELREASLLRSLYGVEVRKAALDLAGHRLAAMQPDVAVSEQLACADSLIEGEGFSWAAQWPEVASRGGFDLVVGNPPYLRHEQIDDPLGRLPKAAYKRRATEAIYRRLPDFFAWSAEGGAGLRPLDGRSDLSTFFTFLGLSLLRPGGVLGFVLPVGLFQARYGEQVGAFLGHTGRQGLLLERRFRRSFRAGVNTAILVAWESGVEACPAPLHQIEARTLSNGARVSGLESRQSDRLLRRLLSRLESRLTTLGSLGRLRYPIKSGINRFFYPKAETVARFRIEPEFCRPVLRSPRYVQRIALRREDVPTTLFACPLSQRDLVRRGKWGALRYIEWGSTQRTPGGTPWPEVPSARGRRQWYTLSLPQPADVLCPRFFDRRYFFIWPQAPVLEDQTFYGLILGPSGREHFEPLLALLSSSLTYLLLETHGRTGLGDGVRQYALCDLAALPLVDPRAIRRELQPELIRRFRAVASRPILPVEREVFEEDRLALDATVAAALGLREADMDEVRTDLLERTLRRLARARSVKR